MLTKHAKSSKIGNLIHRGLVTACVATTIIGTGLLGFVSYDLLRTREKRREKAIETAKV